MPGIIGLATVGNHREIENLISTMVEACAYQEKYEKEAFLDVQQGIAFSRLHLGVFNQGKQPIYSHDRQVVILFDGELYGNSSGKSDPAFILDRYEHLGDNCVKGIDGIYAFVILDFQKNLLKIFNDHFGFKPIYYYQSARNFLFASEIKAILPHYEGVKKRNDNAIADFFVFGFPLGNETLFSDIQLLPAASCLIYDLNLRTFSIKKYWQLMELFNPKGQRKNTVDYPDIVNCFKEAVRRRFHPREAIGLSLSAGLDSRSILAVLGERARGIQTYTIGLRNCRDQSLAQAMSKIMGTIHEFIEVRPDDLKQYKEMANTFVYLTDGLFHLREGTEIVALNYFKRAPFKILLRGHGGEIAKAALAHPVMADRMLLSLRNKDDILQWLLTKGNHITPNLSRREVFNPSFNNETNGHTYNYLKNLLDEALEVLEPGDVALYFYIDQMSRRFTVPSLDIFRTQIEIRVPHFDLEYLKMVLEMPIESRLNGEVQKYIVKSCQHKLMKVPDSNTGAPLDASRWEAFCFDKLNSLFRKLRFTSFRHYTEYPRWQREYFRDDIKNILFFNISKNRRIYNYDSLGTIFENHMKAKTNAAAFLGTAVGIELWHRQYFDGTA